MSKKRHIRVMLEYFHPWPNSGGFYMAREQGYYANLDIDVELVTGDLAYGDALAHLNRGTVDFAICPANRLMVRRDQGEDLLSVAAINHTGLEAIQSLRSKGIQRPRDLEGRILALNPTPRGLAMIHHLVSMDGGNPERVQYLDAGYRELRPEDLATGVADASFGGYWAWEALMDSSVPDAERVVMPVNSFGAPAYHSYLLAAQTDWLSHNPQLVGDFLQATARGFHLAAQHPVQAAALYEHVTPYLPSRLLATSAESIAPSWFHRGQWGLHQQSLLKGYAEWLFKYGILRHESIWQQAATDAYLAEVCHVE